MGGIYLVPFYCATDTTNTIKLFKGLKYKVKNKDESFYYIRFDNHTFRFPREEEGKSYEIGEIYDAY